MEINKTKHVNAAWNLSELASCVKHVATGDISDVVINGIEYDSRHINSGNLFVCITGTFSDGHEYAQAAVGSGAVALMTERRLNIDIPQIIVRDTRAAMADMAAKYYGYPSREMTIVGVTGTNGKTTTTYMLKAIAEQAGKKCGIIGTIKNTIGDISLHTERTTPESVQLQELLRTMSDAGVEIVFMEVSSHSLVQRRVHGIIFDVAEFTNLTQDHLDYHKTFENYFEAKQMLFRVCRHAVINADDSYAHRITENMDCPVTMFGITRDADIYAKNIDLGTTGVDFTLHMDASTTSLHVPIPGLFSVLNALGASAVAAVLGFDWEDIRLGLRNMLSVSGRLEPLNTYGRSYTVLLDYAHAPDALENILKTVHGFAKGRIITLFGCGGDRDKAKRSIMGEIAGRLSDVLIVTSDNPRTENPLAIIEMIMDGVRKSACEHIIIENRRQAIEYALNNAQDDDVIILAGKGHENYQEINGVKHHFDEKELVDELLRR